MSERDPLLEILRELRYALARAIEAQELEGYSAAFARRLATSRLERVDELLFAQEQAERERRALLRAAAKAAEVQ